MRQCGSAWSIISQFITAHFFPSLSESLPMDLLLALSSAQCTDLPSVTSSLLAELSLTSKSPVSSADMLQITECGLAPAQPLPLSSLAECFSSSSRSLGASGLRQPQACPPAALVHLLPAACGSQSASRSELVPALLGQRACVWAGPSASTTTSRCVRPATSVDSRITGIAGRIASLSIGRCRRWSVTAPSSREIVVVLLVFALPGPAAGADVRHVRGRGVEGRGGRAGVLSRQERVD
jgi:hypothetical protein